MTSRFIQKLQIHWDRIGPDSYLRDIPAFNSLEQLEFSRNMPTASIRRAEP